MDKLIWHCFEIVLESSIYIGAFLNKEEADEDFANAMKMWEPVVETYVLGTVEAETFDKALDAVRLGDWLSSTQLV